VFSARYAGDEASYEDNVRKLLDELRDVPLERRGAEFRTVIVAEFPGEGPFVVLGTLKGTITVSPRGTGIRLRPRVRTRGREPNPRRDVPEEKNAISHRGKALRHSPSRSRNAPQVRHVHRTFTFRVEA